MNKGTVLALGAGAMGTGAAMTCAGFDEVQELIVADLSIEASTAAAKLCGIKAKPVSVDVTDHAGLVKLMRESEIVMNSVGPFFRFGVPILEAAIEAGVNYIDICDDPEPTRDMHLLNKKAEEAGISAIVGMGASPGITNMLAARARKELDKTTELVSAWNIEENTGEKDQLIYSAAIVHWMQQCSGTILECENGKLVENKPLKEVELDYPGRGKRTLYTVGHPEPVSFHFAYPDLKRSYCLMVVPGIWIDSFKELSAKIDTEELTLEEAGQELVKGSDIEAFFYNMIKEIAQFFEGPRLPIFFSMAKGEKNGRPAVSTATINSIPPGMAGATGIPLAIGTRLYLQGKVTHKGVLAPEITFDVDEFFQMLLPYCTFPEKRSISDFIDIQVKAI